MFTVGDQSSPDRVCLKWLALHCTECVLFRRAQASRLTEIDMYIATVIVVMEFLTILLKRSWFLLVESQSTFR